MIAKGELYTGHHFLTRVNIFRTDESPILSVVPRNRTEFILFYPNELLTIHQMDEQGHLHFYHVKFVEIKMIRSKVYYQFEIHSTEIYKHMKNKVRQSKNIVALMTNFHTYFPVDILSVTDEFIELDSKTVLPSEHIGFIYYLGKKKIYAVAITTPDDSDIKATSKNLKIQQKIYL